MKCSPYVLIIDEGEGLGPPSTPTPFAVHVRPSIWTGRLLFYADSISNPPDLLLASTLLLLLLLHGRSPVPAVCLSVCLSICLSPCPSVYLSACLSVYCMATTSYLCRLLFFPRDADGTTYLLTYGSDVDRVASLVTRPATQR